MTKNKPKSDDVVITTIRAPRPFWAKVRNQAFVEGLGTGELILKVLAEYLKQGGK
jgi:thiaminase